ncbi:MAG: serine protease [Bacteroidales bacterium]|jgi:membrane-bound ClpP family serine protease|nr:serine protease [Bacteroidales bacterium]MCI1784876.1 serine protease [Bacteroidales bacterium]
MGLIITLIIVGVILVLAEMLLIPGVGVAGILGLVSLAGSGFYAFYHFGNYTGTIVTVIDAGLVIGMLFYVLRAKTWKKLALNTVIDTKAHPETAKIVPGDKGRTLTRIAPSGMARIGNITCEVKAMEEMIDPDKAIEVVSIEDNKIFVKPTTELSEK